MNCIVVLPDEYDGELAVLTGERARYVREFHDLSPDITIRAALYGRSMGRARVNSVSDDKIVLHASFSESAPDKEAIEWIIATPRPQAVKRVLQNACMQGVHRLHFIRSSGVVKSYFDSKVLKPEGMRYELIKALEQAVDAVPPEVQIHEFFSPFINEFLPARLKEDPAVCLIADTYELTRSVKDAVHGRSGERVFVAIGPESGWSRAEIEQFSSLGFQSVSLGKRMLRVDTAASIISSQVALLR